MLVWQIFIAFLLYLFIGRPSSSGTGEIFGITVRALNKRPWLLLPQVLIAVGYGWLGYWVAGELIQHVEWIK